MALCQRFDRTSSQSLRLARVNNERYIDVLEISEFLNKILKLTVKTRPEWVMSTFTSCIAKGVFLPLGDTKIGSTTVTQGLPSVPVL